jgi:hypothetical protein
MRYRIYRTETVERNYECPRCGIRGVTFVRGRGSSTFRQGLIFDDEAGELSARADAAMAVQDDASRVLALIACPGCKQRAPGAIGWSIARLTFGLVATGLLVAIVGVVVTLAYRLPLWVVPLVGLVAIVAGAWTEVGRWREAGRARTRLTDLRPASPEKTLPRAVARQGEARRKETAPVAGPRSAPVVPVASVAPPRDPEPPAPGEGPRFLG